MTKISIKATNLPSVVRALQDFGPEHERETGTALRRGMEHAKKLAVRLAQPDRTLAQTIYSRTVKASKGWSSSLGATAPQARIRERGGVIRAIHQKYLTFMGRDGHLVQVKEVRQTARPYLAPARLQSRDELVHELRGGMVRTTESIRRKAS